MKVIGTNKETKKKVYFDIYWNWGDTTRFCLVCEEGVERSYYPDNRFCIDPKDYDWSIEKKV